MKRTILATLLTVSVIFGLSTKQAYGQTADPIDLVLLLDTSSGMNSSYDHVSNFLTGTFLNEYLRVGDTFHLITFSAAPKLDIARRVSGIGDVETIIGRMLLQYPVERGSNIGAAISYTEQYVISLPTRAKKIILVSVGASDTNTLVTAARGRLAARNATIDFIQVNPGSPLTNIPPSGRPSPSAATATTAARGSPAAPSVQGIAAPSAAVSGAFTTDTALQTAPVTPSWETAQTETPADTRTGMETETGIETEIETASEVSIFSPEQDFAATNIRSTEATHTTTDASWVQSLPLIIAGILGILLLLGLLFLLFSRRKNSGPDRVMAEAASLPPNEKARFVDHSKDLATYAAGTARRTTPYDDRPALSPQPVINPSGPLLLNLFVEDQNTAIGKRNIHSLKSGYSLSVGGGKTDDFLIFLVPIPGNIGEIRRNGSSLTFIPRKHKYFPDIGSNEVKDCINKTIRIVSDKNYEMRFRFEMYEDPLVALNRILMSVRVPG
jgi:hypothetical protein